MNKTGALLPFLLLGVYTTCAQQGNNQIRILAEVSVGEDAVQAGYGGYIKFLYGVGSSAQVTLTAGVKKSNEVARYKNTIRAVPVLLGYKQNLRRFYAEPQAGFGELGGRHDIGGDWARPSRGALFWALGAGYNFNRLDLGLRYQAADAVHKQGPAGSVYNRFDYFGLYAGYVLWRK